MEEALENELQLRRRIVENHVKERNNCIVLKIDRRQDGLSNINPFSFHFELDKVKYENRRKQIRRERITQWFSWIAYYHHKFGIRHLMLVTMLFLYVILGASIFLAIEQPNEIRELETTINLMNSITDEDVQKAINLTMSLNGTQRDAALSKLFKIYYRSLLQAEGKFHGSTWHKAENIDMRRTWSFSSSAFYSITLFSTIGYGTLACDTHAGRIVTIIYAAIGLPLMLVVLGDLGDWFQKILTQAYVFCLCKIRHFQEKPELSSEEKEALFLPIWLAVPLVGVYLFLTTFFVHLFDHDEGQLPGIGAWDAFYFTFISLTTIGLGDVMPYNIQYSPVLACVFLFGLALVSVVNTSIYAQLYDAFFKSVNWIEDSLEKIHRQQHHGTGYYVFQDLGPSLQLLVCSFPHVEDESNLSKPMKAMFAPLDMLFKHKPKKTVIPHIFHKKKRLSEEPKSPTQRQARAPTLGAFGGGDIIAARRSEKNRITRHASDVASKASGKKTRTFSSVESNDTPPKLREHDDSVKLFENFFAKPPKVELVDETVAKQYSVPERSIAAESNNSEKIKTDTVLPMLDSCTVLMQTPLSLCISEAIAEELTSESTKNSSHTSFENVTENSP